MRKIHFIVMALTIAVGAGGLSLGLHSASESERHRSADELAEIIRNTHSTQPGSGLARDWHDCLERGPGAADGDLPTMLCGRWTRQGVTSSLYALAFGEERVPVVESHVEGADVAGRVVVDIQGGPGGIPFHANPAMTEEMVARLRESGLQERINGTIDESPYLELMKRGFTVASIGYWGTNMRTLNRAGEIELAQNDVRRVIDHYRDRLGREPALITTSLGNHLALGALGRERIEGMDVLALVPVMDGLQQHLALTKSVIASARAKAEAAGKPFGQWSTFNIYTGTAAQPVFDRSRLLPMHDYVPRFVGRADLAWGEIELRSPCAKTVIGSHDPRNADYVRRTRTPALHVEWLAADHDIFRDQPEWSREIVKQFAQCLAAQTR